MQNAYQTGYQYSAQTKYTTRMSLFSQPTNKKEKWLKQNQINNSFRKWKIKVYENLQLFLYCAWLKCHKVWSQGGYVFEIMNNNIQVGWKFFIFYSISDHLNKTDIENGEKKIFKRAYSTIKNI